jgi:hypothetical protein
VSFLYGRREPGPCPICGAPHHSCTTFSATQATGVSMTQLPQRDRLPSHDEALATAQARFPSAQSTKTYSKARRHQQRR